jgi:hypothetical protein
MFRTEHFDPKVSMIGTIVRIYYCPRHYDYCLFRCKAASRNFFGRGPKHIYCNFIEFRF